MWQFLQSSLLLKSADELIVCIWRHTHLVLMCKQTKWRHPVLKLLTKICKNKFALKSLIIYIFGWNFGKRMLVIYISSCEIKFSSRPFPLIAIHFCSQFNTFGLRNPEKMHNLHILVVAIIGHFTVLNTYEPNLVGQVFNLVYVLGTQYFWVQFKQWYQDELVWYWVHTKFLHLIACSC